MRRIHPVWHVSQLEPAYESDFVGRTQPTPSPVIVEGEAEHEVDSILDSRLDRRRRPPLMYLVKWSGYDGTPDESTWEPAVNLEHAPNFSLILFPSLRVQFVLILCVCDLHKSYITKLSVGNAHFGYALVGSAAAPFGALPTLHPSPYSSSLPPFPPHHYYLSPHRQRLCPNRRQS